MPDRNSLTIFGVVPNVVEEAFEVPEGLENEVGSGWVCRVLQRNLEEGVIDEIGLTLGEEVELDEVAGGQEGEFVVADDA